MRTLWLLVLVFAVGCASVPFPVEPSDDLAVMKASVCRVGRWTGGHGSGVAFLRQDGYTYIMTAKHVVEGAQEHPFILAYSLKGKDRIEIATVSKVSKKYDLAVLKTEGSNLHVLPISLKIHDYQNSSWYRQTWDEDVLGTLNAEYKYQWIYGVGYMYQLYPPVVSVGRILFTQDYKFGHSAASWFGSSGGPVVDPYNMSIIGITVALHVIDGVPQSDQIVAVNLKAIYEFLEEP